MNVQDVLLTAIESLAKTAVVINSGIKEDHYELESDILNNNLDYAIESIIDISELLSGIREKSTRSMLAGLSASHRLNKDNEQ